MAAESAQRDTPTVAGGSSTGNTRIPRKSRRSTTKSPTPPSEGRRSSHARSKSRSRTTSTSSSAGRSKSRSSSKGKSKQSLDSLLDSAPSSTHHRRSSRGKNQELKRLRSHSVDSHDQVEGRGDATVVSTAPSVRELPRQESLLQRTKISSSDKDKSKDKSRDKDLKERSQHKRKSRTSASDKERRSSDKERRSSDKERRSSDKERRSSASKSKSTATSRSSLADKLKNPSTHTKQQRGRNSSTASKYARSNSCDSRRQPEQPPRQSISKPERSSGSSKRASRKDSSLQQRKSSHARSSATATTLDQAFSSSTTRQGRSLAAPSSRVRSNSCDSRLSTDMVELKKKQQPQTTKKEEQPPQSPFHRSNSGPAKYNRKNSLHNKRPSLPPDDDDDDDVVSDSDDEPSFHDDGDDDEECCNDTSNNKRDMSLDPASRRTQRSQQREEELCYHDSARSSLPDETTLPSLLDDLLVRNSTTRATATTARTGRSQVRDIKTFHVRSNSVDSRRDTDSVLPEPESSKKNTSMLLLKPSARDNGNSSARTSRIARSKSFDPEYPDQATTAPRSIRERRMTTRKRSSMGYRDSSIDDTDAIPTGSMRGGGNRRELQRRPGRRGSNGTTLRTASKSDHARKSIRHSRSFDPRMCLEENNNNHNDSSKDNDDNSNNKDSSNDHNTSNGNPKSFRRSQSGRNVLQGGTGRSNSMGVGMGRRQTLALLDKQAQIRDDDQKKKESQAEKVAAITKAFKVSNQACADMASETAMCTDKLRQLPNALPTDIAMNTTRSSSSSSTHARKGLESLVQLQEMPSLSSAMRLTKPSGTMRRLRSSESSASQSTATTLSNSFSLHSSSTGSGGKSFSTLSSTSTGGGSSSFGSSSSYLASSESGSISSSNASNIDARKRLMAKAHRMKALSDSFRKSASDHRAHTAEMKSLLN